MNVFTWLNKADEYIFRLINNDLANPWLDGWMDEVSS